MQKSSFRVDVYLLGQLSLFEAVYNTRGWCHGQSLAGHFQSILSLMFIVGAPVLCECAGVSARVYRLFQWYLLCATAHGP